MRKISFANAHHPLHIHPDTSIIFLTGRCYTGISWLYSDDAKEYFYNKLLEILLKYKLELDAWVIYNNHYHLLLRVKQGGLIAKFVKHLHGSTAHYIKQQMPEVVAGDDQILMREITPWDKRQAERFNRQAELLERRINSANTEPEKKLVIAQFIALHKSVLAKLTAKQQALLNLKDQALLNLKDQALLISPSRPRGLKSANTTDSVVAKFISRIRDPQILALLAVKEAPVWYQYMDHVIRNEEDYYKHLNYIHQNPVKHGYVKKMSDYKWSSIHKWIKKEGKEFIADCFRQYPIIDFRPIAE